MKKLIGAIISIIIFSANATVNLDCKIDYESRNPKILNKNFIVPNVFQELSESNEEYTQKIEIIGNNNKAQPYLHKLETTDRKTKTSGLDNKLCINCIEIVYFSSLESQKSFIDLNFILLKSNNKYSVVGNVNNGFNQIDIKCSIINK